MMRGTLSKSIAVFTLLLSISTNYAQTLGCTDVFAENYNPAATQNDGTCQYQNDSINTVWSHELPMLLDETSGIIVEEESIVVHNDYGGAKLFFLTPPNYEDIDMINAGVNVIDFEELDHDEEYYYLGDFGNNYGNRIDLRIYRLKKSTLPEIVVDTISYFYEDQTDFSYVDDEVTDFDCEAMIIHGDSIYLFTKQWTSKESTVYRIPKAPGNYMAEKISTFDVNGLITGATKVEGEDLVVLCGYSITLRPFVYLLYDYQGDDFFSGNKRKIKLNLNYHQVEAIASIDGLRYYLTNENFQVGPFGAPQRLHLIDLTDYLVPDTSSLSIENNEISYQIYPNPVQNGSKLYFQTIENINRVQIIDMNGRIVIDDKPNSSSIEIKESILPGMYQLLFLEDELIKSKTRVIIK